MEVNQVEHLLKLADEYQALGIVGLCVKILKSEPKSQDNAMKILHLVTSTVIARDDQRLFEVREQCYELIKDMKLTEAQENEDCKNLEKEIWERVLVKRIQRLETFVQEIYPQFMGLVECCLSLYFLGKTKGIPPRPQPPHPQPPHPQPPCPQPPCPQHFSFGRTRGNLLSRMKNCIECQQMIKQLVWKPQAPQHLPFPGYGYRPSVGFRYEGEYHFDEEVITIIQDFEKIINIRV